MKTSFALFLLFLSGSGGMLLSSLLDISLFEITVCHEEKLIDKGNLISATLKKELNYDFHHKHHHYAVNPLQLGSHLIHGDKFFCNQKADH